ncbi:uncharacterized protein LOC135842924 [Planococcus citri]|uniref:uncharacterized protein LOC135842924 n=1 Tax=Planococcus citri TaxID=170843 RepID=UPI0031FA277D
MEEHMNDSINEKRCPLDNIQIHYSPLKLKPIKWTEKTAKKEPEINLGPLEVRVSRMHLEERPKDSTKCTIAAAPNTHNNNSKNPATKTSKQRIKLTHKECKPIVYEESNLDERLLSAKVNPLMTILMSPHLKQYIEQEEKRDRINDVNFKRKSLNKIKVKSLEFPDDSNARGVGGGTAKLQKSRSTPSPSNWVQKTLKCKIADGQTRPIKRCDL